MKASSDIIKQIVAIEKETFGNGVNADTLNSLVQAFPEGLILINDDGIVHGYLGWEKHTAKQFPEYNHDVGKTYAPNGSHGYISIITVASQFRDKGLGSNLLKQLETIAKKHKCTSLYCPVNKKHPYLNQGVMHFWEKNGFKVSGETNWEISPGKILPSFIFNKTI